MWVFTPPASLPWRVGFRFPQAGHLSLGRSPVLSARGALNTRAGETSLRPFFFIVLLLFCFYFFFCLQSICKLLHVHNNGIHTLYAIVAALLKPINHGLSLSCDPARL